MAIHYFSERIKKAIDFAARAHEGQYRRIQPAPFITHPFMVGLVLAQAGFSEDMIIAGFLHDTVEDTKVTMEEIKNTFGKQVAELVLQLTDPPGLPYRERKLHQVAVLEKASEGVKAIKAIDTLFNLHSYVDNRGKDTWANLDHTKEDALWGYKKILKTLRQNWNHPLLKEIEKYLKEFEKM